MTISDQMLEALQSIARSVDKELFRDPRPGGGLLLVNKPKFDFSYTWKPLIPFSAPKVSDDYALEARIGTYHQIKYTPSFAYFADSLVLTRLEVYGWDGIKAMARSRRFEDEHDVW